MRNMSKSISMLLAILMVWISLPYGYAFAAIIGTEKVASSLQGQHARGYLQSVLAREEVQTILIEHGINAAEAKNRISGLTDAEALRLAKEMEKQPAGGDAVGIIAIASVFVFIVLLVTDILGYTDIFPFVKKVK